MFLAHHSEDILAVAMVAEDKYQQHHHLIHMHDLFPGHGIEYAIRPTEFRHEAKLYRRLSNTNARHATLPLIYSKSETK